MLRLAGGTAAAALVGSSALGSVQAAEVIDLGDKGLSDGDVIDPYLNDYWTNGTEVHIPEGTYEWHGDGFDATADAALIGDGTVVLETDGTELRENITATSGTVLIKNITDNTYITDGSDGSRIAAWAESGATLVLENFNRPRGQEEGSDNTGFYVPPEHAGEVYFRNCTVNRCNNGIYASTPEKDGGGGGRVVVEGGLFKNNNIAAVRLGSTDSVARHVTIHNDAPIPEDTTGDPPGLGRGIWVRQGGDNLSIYSCDITMEADSDGSTSPITINPDADDVTGGSGSITDCRIHHDRDGDAIEISDTAGSWGGSGDHITGTSTRVDSDYQGTIECSGDGCNLPTTEKQWVDENGNLIDGSSSDTSTESTLSVSTQSTTDVESSSATLEGSLDDLGDASKADVYFEYRESGASDWSATTLVTKSSTGGYSRQVDGLSAVEEYEFRAAADGSNGSTDTGGTQSFTTGDLFEIEPTGSDAVTYEFTIDGDVALATTGDNQADGDEDVVQNDDGTVTVSDSTGGGDAFYVGGTFTELTVSPDGSYQLYLNGQEVTVEDLLGTNGTTVTFRQEVDGYSGTVDTYIQEDVPTADNSTAATLNVDTNDPHGTGQDVHALLRFDDVVGSDIGQVPPGASVSSATLTVETTNPGDGASIHRMTTNWSDTDSWDSFGNDGIQAGSEAASSADATTGSVAEGQTTIDVTASVQAWVNGKTNNGWAFLPSGGDGWDFYAAEGETPPTLTVIYESTDGSDSGSAPNIDRYEVTEADSPNPHANITVEWDVSDADGDLASSLVQVIDSNGNVVDSSRTSISGDVKYGVDYFEIKNVDGQQFDVTVLVADEAGHEASASQTITE